MDLELSGRRAWVVGGSSGLGLAVAERLVSEGAKVAVSGRDMTRLSVAAAALGATDVQLDLADGPAAIAVAAETAAKRLGGLEIVVFNHGRPPTGGFAETTAEAFDAAYGLMLASAFTVTKAVMPYLEAAESAVIAYITSSSTKEVLPNLLLSNVMRLGVVGLMKSIAIEYASKGVRAVCVAPGRFATPPVLARTGGSRKDGSIPIGRLGEPKEFGDVVAFVCSTRGSYMTGCTVVIDGGHLRTVTA